MQQLRLQAYVDYEDNDEDNDENKMIMAKVTSITPFENHSYVYIEWDDYEYQVDNMNIRLWTWLIDKNGTEIYEWDFLKSIESWVIVQVKIGHYDDSRSSQHDIVWVYMEQVSNEKLPLWINKAVFTKSSTSIVEVIGNIYQNPELLPS